ncbi:hypothetical protein CHRYSEOSP005_23680 [Chryseobacterium sp. Alg-005]
MMVDPSIIYNLKSKIYNLLRHAMSEVEALLKMNYSRSILNLVDFFTS